MKGDLIEVDKKNLELRGTRGTRGKARRDSSGVNPGLIGSARIGVAMVLLWWCAVVAFGIGSDYPPGETIDYPQWPKGLKELVNRPERVHGFFVNAEEIFFYAGDAKAFNAFLRDYAAADTTSHTLVLHSGAGKAKSPWDKGEGVACDWKLEAYPAGWRDAKPGNLGRGYTMTVHLWTGGKVSVKEINVPLQVSIFASDAPNEEIKAFISAHRLKQKK